MLGKQICMIIISSSWIDPWRQSLLSYYWETDNKWIHNKYVKGCDEEGCIILERMVRKASG